MPNDWKTLSDETQIDQIISDSNKRPQIIFKHSTRCSTSALAYRRLRIIDSDLQESADIHYLDVIGSRPISHAVAERFGIPHESPQLLIIKDGQVVWHESHFAIQSDVVLDAVKELRVNQ